MTAMEDWAGLFVEPEPGGEITKEEARASWVMFCSEVGLRPGPGTGMSKAIVAAGGKARQKPTRWEGVALRVPEDSGYRPGNPDGVTWHQAGWAMLVGRQQVTEALRRFQAAGLVTDRDALNDAWRELVA